MADRSGYIGRAPGDSSIVISRQTFNPIGVQTDFTFSSGYIPGYLDVYLNGVRLIEANDYTATDTSVVGLTSAAQNGDVLEMVAYKAFNVAVVSEALSDFIVGNDLKVSRDVTITGDVSGRNFTGVAATFTGNVTVGGVLTYEDVTNVDSLGILTARTGVSVLAGGVDVDAGGINVDAGGLNVAGVTTLSQLISSNSSLTGVTTVSQLSSGNVTLTGISNIANVTGTTLNATGVSTFSNVVVGGATTELVVTGDARVTGILTVGTSSVTINGSTGKIIGASDTQLAGIGSTISDTAVDVFVYDTSKDSDGGAWRKRTQNTSWYNETLNTATRGSRKEFPAVAVIVCGTDGSNGYVHIYDGDDPDLPMWMKFSSNAAALYTTPNAVSAINGTILVALPTYGLVRYDFAGDTIGRWRANTNFNGYKSPDRSIGGRDTATATFIDGSPFTNALVGDNINDVAITVLPNAPVDTATGLLVPTIAVGTDNGTSVIKDDETVADLTGFSPITTIHIDEDNVIATSNSGTPSHDYIFKTHIPSSDETYSAGIAAGSKNYYITSNTGTIPRLRDIDMSDSSYDSKDDVVYRGGNGGFDIIRPGVNYSTTHSNPTIAYISKDYNTGYMQGDIKGAFLSDTDTADVVGSNLIDATAASWTTYTGSGSVTNPSSGVLEVADSDGSYDVYQNVTTVAGEQYILSYNTTSTRETYFVITDGSNVVVTNGNSFNYTGTYVGRKSMIFTAPAGTTTRIRVSDGSGGALTVTVSELQLRLAEEDRSVNNNGLQVFGTITKSAVATGADLVGYSGFSASNRLINSDFTVDFGNPVTISIAFWQKLTDITDYSYVVSFADGGSLRGGISNGPDTTSYPGEVYFNMGNQTIYSEVALNDGLWHCVVGTINENDKRLYVDGVLVSSTVINDYDMSGIDEIFVGAFDTQYHHLGSLSLMRVSKTVPSAEQVKKMYEDEKYLFQENSQATLYGSSDDVTALVYDDDTNLLHVGTSAGRSEFQGLRRINNTTTAVTTAISASNDLVAEQ